MQKKERKSNIELLRILSAIGVIILHINNPKGINYAMTESMWGGVNTMTLNALEFLADPAVNIFILITGFFMCKSMNFSIKKPVSLLLQLLILKGFVSVAFVLIAHKPLSLEMIITTVFPQKYFVVLYIGLVFIAPYINRLLEILTKRETERLLLVMLLFFSIWPFILDVIKELASFNLDSSNTIGHYGSQGGQTIISFILIYMIGAYLRLYDVLNKIVSIKKPLLFLLLVFLVQYPMICWESIERITLDERTFLAYHNPFVILEAVVIFVLFSKLNIQSKLINSLASSAFTCYIASGYFKGVLFSYSFLRQPIYIMLGYLFLYCIVVYLLSWCYFYVYNKIVTPMVDRYIH